MPSDPPALEKGGEIGPEGLARISPYLTEHVERFGEYSAHEYGVQPEVYDPGPDVGFPQLRGQDPTAPPVAAARARRSHGGDRGRRVGVRRTALSLADGDRSEHRAEGRLRG